MVRIGYPISNRRDLQNFYEVTSLGSVAKILVSKLGDAYNRFVCPVAASLNLNPTRIFQVVESTSPAGAQSLPAASTNRPRPLERPSMSPWALA